jgi:uncharacterized repeat protein (TIGR04076 family)
MRLIIRVKDIIGRCAVYNGGERIVVDDFIINPGQSDRICIHALAPILHYLTALKEGVSTVKLGLSEEEGVAYIHCPDCGAPYTPGGRVIFQISRE